MLQTGNSHQRVLIEIEGCVQGVGFRPFIYRLAKRYSLNGYIVNTSSGVKIDAEGDKQALDSFQNAIAMEKPKQSVIDLVRITPLPNGLTAPFQILPSENLKEKKLALLPDTALCSECIKELRDPLNRRYLYPFLHCISCGPRFSLFLQMPFDRAHTTMKAFPMCRLCQNEYDDPSNRRFHAQTNCCPECGPQIRLTDRFGVEVADASQAIQKTSEALREGKIVALKNTGGYLLLADATNGDAVEKLRIRKRRPAKPFALLMPDLLAAHRVAQIGALEEELLTSSPAPIVLLKRKKNSQIAPFVSCQSPYYGIMLPHTPLQFLLVDAFQKPLVATSGNCSGQPICLSETEAYENLASIADLFLVHNRAIQHRLDDSIVQIVDNQSVVIRRARGLIPYAIDIPDSISHSDTLFASGAHMKNSFAFSIRNRIYMSQFIGDLDSVESCNAYEREIESWKSLLGVEQFTGIKDLHPHYYSSHYLDSHNIPSKKVQHHRAHVWSGFIDCRLTTPFLSFSWDGTGLGEDGTIWGGESFLVSDGCMERFATLYPFPLPGGEKGVKEPKRALLGLFYTLFGLEIPPSYAPFIESRFTFEERNHLLLACQKKVNAPLCHSIGRLFDGVSALLGLCDVSTFEGEGALCLESIAAESEKTPQYYLIDLVQEKSHYVLDWRPMILKICSDLVQGRSKVEIGLAFHEALAKAIVDLAKIGKCTDILLTGGVMQNRLLVESASTSLRHSGFNPHIPRHIPSNDGGIGVGQIIGTLYERRNSKCV